MQSINPLLEKWMSKLFLMKLFFRILHCLLVVVAVVIHVAAQQLLLSVNLTPKIYYPIVSGIKSVTIGFILYCCG